MIVLLTAFLLAQAGSPLPTDAEERLLSWAASDLAEHLPGRARRFREVRLASLQHPEGVARPLLCGEAEVVRDDGAAEWLSFAALETRGGYEQWLGGSAGTWCNARTPVDRRIDFSRRFEDQLVREE